MIWTKADDSFFEARWGDTTLWATETSDGHAWAVSAGGGIVGRAGTAHSLQEAMDKAKHTAEELIQESLF